MKLLKIRIHFIFVFVLFYFLKPFGLFFKNILKKEVFLFCERGNDAQDNAFFLFNYASTTSLNCKYIISKKSPDATKINKKNLIKYGSLKHIFYLSFSTVIISTHYLLFIPCDISTAKKTSWFLLSPKVVFLQHGIAENFLPDLVYPKCKVDLFCCSVEREYDYILNNYHHPKGVVCKTGMPRFDLLTKNIRSSLFDIKKILVMPTWRLWIHSESDFLLSDYFKRWEAFLSNTTLINELEKKGCSIVFYPHKEMLKYIRFFEKFNNKIVRIINPNNDRDCSVQKELIEADLLITDYSSVAFDFSYMKKPVFYLLDDFEEFFNGHYKKGFFDYKTDSFGDVFDNVNDLINGIKSFSLSSWKEKYINKINKFYEGMDDKNSERIMEKIKCILK